MYKGNLQPLSGANIAWCTWCIRSTL